MNNQQMLRVAHELIHRLRERGIDPEKAARIPLMQTMITQVIRGEWTVEQYLRNVEKLAILNPGIRLPQDSPVPRGKTVIEVMGIE